MPKRVNTRTARFLVHLVYSILLGGALSAIFSVIIRYVYNHVPIPREVYFFIIYIYSNYGFWLSFFISTSCFMILYFLWLLIRMAIYFYLIKESIKKLAEGDFEVEIPIRNQLDLGTLAKSINQMKEQIKVLIGEEKLAVQTKNELITNVSHDLRTPLTSIIGYLRLIEEDQYQDEVELRYFTSVAYEKSLRLNRMVNDLFEFTKITNHDVSIKKINFNLVELLKQLSAQFIPELRDTEMEIEMNNPLSKIMINADPEKIMRVFENLISNAIKYGKDGRKIDLMIEESVNFVTVKVVNYGEPIPAKAVPHIFERLYRIEGSRSVETGGAGLGLAIAKGIVELHQGEISVTSNDTETIFQVKLPH